MASEDEAAAAAQKLSHHALDTLRAQFPFLKAAALDPLVATVAECTRATLEEQEQAMTQSKATFDFFIIPPELRNRIYEHVLFDELDAEASAQKTSREILLPGPYSSNERNERAFKWPGLLCVNRQMRNETLPIYLGQNTFVAPLYKMRGPGPSARHAIRKWLRNIKREHRKVIKSFVFRVCLDGVFERALSTKSGYLRKYRFDKFGVPYEAFRVESQLDYGPLGGLIRFPSSGRPKPRFQVLRD